MWTCAYETETDPKTNINSWPENPPFLPQDLYTSTTSHLRIPTVFPFFLTIFVNQPKNGEKTPSITIPPPKKNTHSVCITIPEGSPLYFPGKNSLDSPRLSRRVLAVQLRFLGIQTIGTTLEFTNGLFEEILPRKLTWNLKMMVSNRNLLFQGFIFRFHVSFPGCSLWLSNQPTNFHPPPPEIPNVPPPWKAMGFFHIALIIRPAISGGGGYVGRGLSSHKYWCFLWIWEVTRPGKTIPHSNSSRKSGGLTPL